MKEVFLERVSFEKSFDCFQLDILIEFLNEPESPNRTIKTIKRLLTFRSLGLGLSCEAFENSSKEHALEFEIFRKVPYVRKFVSYS